MILDVIMGRGRVAQWRIVENGDPHSPQIHAAGPNHLALRDTMCDAPGPYCETKEKGPRDPHKKGDTMGSIRREVRLTQKAAAEAAVAARIAKLVILTPL